MTQAVKDPTTTAAGRVSRPGPRCGGGGGGGVTAGLFGTGGQTGQRASGSRAGRRRGGRGSAAAAGTWPGGGWGGRSDRPGVPGGPRGGCGETLPWARARGLVPPRKRSHPDARVQVLVGLRGTWRFGPWAKVWCQSLPACSPGEATVREDVRIRLSVFTGELRSFWFLEKQINKGHHYNQDIMKLLFVSNFEILCVETVYFGMTSSL